MQDIPYSRLLNRPVRYAKFFTFMDLFVITLAIVFFIPIFGVKFTVFSLLLYTLHILLFRMGKPPGYDIHFFKSLIRPEEFRAGGGRRHRAILYIHDCNI